MVTSDITEVGNDTRNRHNHNIQYIISSSTTAGKHTEPSLGDDAGVDSLMVNHYVTKQLGLNSRV